MKNTQRPDFFGNKFVILNIGRHAMEKRQESIIPLGFWWLSLAGGVMLFVYAAFYLRDPVIIIGQSTGVIIYLRNLYLIYFKKQTTEPDTQEQ